MNVLGIEMTDSTTPPADNLPALVRRLREKMASVCACKLPSELCALACEISEDVPALLDALDKKDRALRALTCWSANGEQLCFRSANGPMGMMKMQEELARQALGGSDDN